MKCKKCKIQIPPGFVAAIAENRCPACGQSMMADGTYKYIYQVKKQISDLGFPEEMLLGISAALATRFTLVPRELAGVEEDLDSAPPEKPWSGPPRRVGSSNVRAASLSVSEEVEEEDGDLTESQKQALIAEYGLDKGDAASVALVDHAPVSSDLLEVASDLDSMDAPSLVGSDEMNLSAAEMRKANLLARARQAKEKNHALIPRRVY